MNANVLRGEMNLAEEIKKATAEDLEEAQDRDYDMILYDLQCRLQKIYDNARSKKKDKLIMDLTFASIMSILEQADDLLK